MRVSNHQIIWGGNYFLYYLGNTQGFLIWDKKQPHDFSLSMCEMAWSSIQSPAKMFRYSVLSGDPKQHPTQKPVKLYEWLLTNYAKPGDRILDTHLGSGSSAIAAHNYGFDFVGVELDADYFAAASARLEQAQSQIRMFAAEPEAIPEQASLM
jgi:site-specific DNA-methyltransferase (adenine-specific)